MLFSTNVFLFLFLPCVLFGYYVLCRTRRMKNFFLFLSSIVFYGYGEPKFVFVLLLFTLLNYILAILIDLTKNKRVLKTIIFIIALILDIGLLFVYKYLNFTIDNINNVFGLGITIKKILLPIGISFFTFQILSYVIDVYRGKVKVQKNLFNLGLYISLFPQLIAGPIVRYETVEDQIMNRKESIDNFSIGVERFIYGLGKKVIIANTMATIADSIFNSPANSNNPQLLLWCAALAYSFQIFFDFSGYSDMAIGLGKMFGFSFEENFNYPYISKSITEFWRRWHISLGTWFRDYVYIPLGGSRCSKVRIIINLLVVWLLTGIWHGANWTFIVWGLMYFILLVIEKITKIDKNTKIPSFIKRIYTLFFVLIGWVIFRADSISYAITYIKRMFAFNNVFSMKVIEVLIENGFIIILAILLSTPIFKWLKDKYKVFDSPILKDIILIVILLMCVSYITKGVYNPFIYFNF